MSRLAKLFGSAAATCGLILTAAVAQDTTQPQPNPPAQQPAEENAEPQDEAGTLQPKQPGEQAEQKAEEGRLFKVEDLVDAKIRNAAGEDLGEIEEMVVDADTGDIRYAVVSYGGFLDLGDKLFAVPLKAMKLSRDEDAKPFYVVDVDKQQLEGTKGFDEDNWPNFADRSFTSSVDETYGIEADAQASGEQAALYKLSTFEGVNVRGSDNAELGEVQWVLVDPQEAKVSHLALELEDELENEQDDDALALVPMSQFRLKTEGDDTFLQVTADAQKLKSAPTVTEEQFEDAASHKELRQKADSHFGTAGKSATPDIPAEPQIDATTDPQSDAAEELGATEEPDTSEELINPVPE